MDTISKHFHHLIAVHLQCLDVDKQYISETDASGFILKENNELFLYTCWHVVTGHDLLNLKPVSQKRKYLKVILQENKETNGSQVLSGRSTFIISLYDDDENPIWIQNKDSQIYKIIKNDKIKVPTSLDIIKIKLEVNENISENQIIEKSQVYDGFAFVGDKLLICGYPYGYSPLGNQPKAIILNRFVASMTISDKPFEVLLDGFGAPGMSGCPVLIENQGQFKLFGVYTGLIYPDYLKHKERTTALGTVCSLTPWFHIIE